MRAKVGFGDARKFAFFESVFSAVKGGRKLWRVMGRFGRILSKHLAFDPRPLTVALWLVSDPRECVGASRHVS
jgi:hypothetical protein